MMLKIFIAGMISTLSPCVLPLIPIVITRALEKSKKALALLLLAFVLSFSVVGTLMGVVSQTLYFDFGITRNVGAAMMILMAALMLLPISFGIFDRASWRFEKSLEKVFPKKAFESSLYLGFALALFWAPCVGPALGAALGWVASSGDEFRGGLHLFLFGLGSACSLFLIGLLTHHLGFPWFHRNKKRLRFLYIFNGLLMILLGTAILLGYDKSIETFLTERLPESWNELLILF